MKKITHIFLIAIIAISVSVFSFSDVLYSDSDHNIPVVDQTQTAQSTQLDLGTFDF
ncbi:MAG: hypothetical protein NTX05_05950 [Fusobacteria bacterium]|nr:hypothetical protein [Fusobacteriota bacterium]